MTLQTLRQPQKKTPLNKIGENIAVFSIHMQGTHT